jgi:hypothetical protein
MHYFDPEISERQEEMRKEHLELTKQVVYRAKVASEYLHGMSLGEGGSRILKLLDESLLELQEFESER